MLRCVMLGRVVLCCTLLFCVVLHCIMLRYDVLCCDFAVLLCIVLTCDVLCRVALGYVVLFGEERLARRLNFLPFQI